MQDTQGCHRVYVNGCLKMKHISKCCTWFNSLFRWANGWQGSSSAKSIRATVSPCVHVTTTTQLLLKLNIKIINKIWPQPGVNWATIAAAFQIEMRTFQVNEFSTTHSCKCFTVKDLQWEGFGTKKSSFEGDLCPSYKHCRTCVLKQKKKGHIMYKINGKEQEP